VNEQKMTNKLTTQNFTAQIYKSRCNHRCIQTSLSSWQLNIMLFPKCGKHNMVVTWWC